MEPFLRNNDMVLASSVPFLFSKPKVGDVVVFKYRNKFFVKRITKLNGSKYFLKGDNIKDSFDSRKFGCLERKMILGKIFLNFKFQIFNL